MNLISRSRWTQALAAGAGGALLVTAALALMGAAPVAISSPEHWANTREVISVFSRMFLGYLAAALPFGLLVALAALPLAGRKGGVFDRLLPAVTGVLFATAGVASSALQGEGSLLENLVENAASAGLAVAASIGAAAILVWVLGSRLRDLTATLANMLVLMGVAFLVLIVRLRGASPGRILQLGICAAAAAIFLLILAGAAHLLPRMPAGGKRAFNGALVIALVGLLVVPIALARQSGDGTAGAAGVTGGVPIPPAGAPGGASIPRQAGDRAAPNVILISIDTLRADRLSCYTPGLGTSPVIDEVAAQGVRFENTFSTSSWTLPAHASILTGLYPSAHGADRSRHQHGRTLIDPLRPDVRTLAQTLGERGYRTAGFVSNPMVSSVFGINRGFEEYHDRIDKLDRLLTFRNSLLWEALLRLGVWTDSDFDGEVKVDEFLPAVLDWIGRHADEKFFLFAHFMEPHYIYEPPERFRIGADGRPIPIFREIEPLISGRFSLPPDRLGELDTLYDGEVSYIDEKLGEIFSLLDRLDLTDDTIVIILSDHGESLGERDLWTHGSSLHEEQVRVPLIMRWPGVIPPGTVVGEGLASLVDIMPTILDLTGEATPEGLQGHSLRPLWEEGDVSGFQTAYAELRADIGWKAINPRLGGGVLMVRTATAKYLVPDDGSPELFLLAEDPGELVDAAARRPDLVNEMGLGLKAWQARTRPEGEAAEGEQLDAATLEQLRTLGYVR